MRLLLLLPTLLCTTAFGELLQVRGHYGSLQAKPGTFNSQMDGFVTNAPALSAPTTYGADALFSPPLLPVVLGLRYEQFAFKKSGDGQISGTAVTTTSQLSGSRTALLVGFRPLSLPVAYVGVLLQYALSQSFKYKMSSVNGGGSTHVDEFNFKADAGYGAALEAGVRLGPLSAGLEAGYLMAKTKNATDGTGTVLDKKGEPIKLDLSSPYLKAVLGYGF